MANHMKMIMPDLVNPCQSSFVPKRQITDNIVVYQETLHTMRKKRGETGYMALKIDLEKAYDRLAWSFIRETLSDAGINEDWCRNIMHCIETTRMSILWNGEPTDWFKPSRGIRQGDAMSPFIFVLCIEKLSHMIKEEVANGRWKGVKLTKDGPMITHLMFADDMTLFSEASMEQMTVIKECLDKFYSISGQKVNYTQSQIFFSADVREDLAVNISSLAGISKTNNLGRYLGVPSIHGRMTSSMFTPLLDHIKAQLEGWKAKQLSFAGRVVLAQSVLCSIPYFSMQTNLLPKGVCRTIDRIIRCFI